MDYVCRKLNASDLNMVMEMNRHFRDSFVCRENVEHFLSNPMNWLYAAVCGQTIIGFAYGYEVNRLDGKGNMLYIHEVGVMEPYQRTGVGSRLLTELKNTCAEKSICRFFLVTAQDNVGANALYRKLGGETDNNSGGNDICYFFLTK
jgi:ribosomal protein S18 acetylase RimI-like enzyme